MCSIGGCHCQINFTLCMIYNSTFLKKRGIKKKIAFSHIQWFNCRMASIRLLEAILHAYFVSNNEAAN